MALKRDITHNFLFPKNIEVSNSLYSKEKQKLTKQILTEVGGTSKQI